VRSKFLTALRGPDARRLVLLLAAVLVFAGLFDGLGAGKAATSGLTILCQAADGGSVPGNAPDDRHTDCCLSGHRLSPGDLPAKDRFAPSNLPPQAGPARGAGGGLTATTSHASTGPRGPPLSG
jgi:hypothetical protein